MKAPSEMERKKEKRKSLIIFDSSDLLKENHLLTINIPDSLLDLSDQMTVPSAFRMSLEGHEGLYIIFPEKMRDVFHVTSCHLYLALAPDLKNNDEKYQVDFKYNHIMKLDHIAIKTENLERSIEWYCKLLPEATILYKDSTWALLSGPNWKIAFVYAREHKPHIAFEYKGEEDDSWKTHRDGSRYKYIEDPDGNVVELLKWNK